MDADAGGAADLQTDVMRFMAILALCLVAIFALVQSIPLAPASPDPPPVPADKEPESTQALPEVPEAPPQPDAKPEPREVIQTVRVASAFEHRPPPRPQPETRQETPAKTMAKTEAPPLAAAEPEAVEAPIPEVAEAPVPDEGFSLRFETGTALTRLVARGDVGLYAIGAGQALRMNVDRGEMSFWPASAPKQFHEMHQATVPGDVISALHRSGKEPADEVKWGVTLPSPMTAELNRILAEQSGGALVIGSSGALRLEP